MFPDFCVVVTQTCKGPLWLKVELDFGSARELTSQLRLPMSRASRRRVLSSFTLYLEACQMGGGVGVSDTHEELFA